MSDERVAVFETERLVVRPWAGGDVDRFFDMYSRWDVMRWLGRTPTLVPDRADALARIERWSGQGSADGHYGIWALEVRDSGLIAGTVLLKPLPDADGVPTDDVEVGWHLHPDSWGRGYATEGARSAVERGWAGGLDEVWAVVAAGNDPSVAVTRRLGMVAQGPTTRWYGIELESFRLRRDAGRAG